MSIPELRYPNKSHRKTISLPQESPRLAELMGIIFGDGGINNNWQLTITLNSEADSKYSYYVIYLLKTLFKISVAVRKRPCGKTLVLVCSSMNLLDFLISKGAVKGNKILQKIDIPLWIKYNLVFTKYFIRGLVDTDGCLYTHIHKTNYREYFNIGFCFTSYSKNLTYSLHEIFIRLGIKSHLGYNNQRIFLYGEKEVLKYLKIFGSSNPRIYQKYFKWRGARVV